MTDKLSGETPDHREVGHELARLSGVNLKRARKAVVRRGLALVALVRGNKEEAAKIMAHAKRRLGKTESSAIDAAREQ